MCLSYDFSPESAVFNKYKTKGWFRVYKVATINKTFHCFNPPLMGYHPYKKGLQQAQNLEKKNGGWYAFTNILGAWRWKSRRNEKIIVCWAKGQYVKRLGGFLQGRAGIFTHLVFPKYPHRIARKPKKEKGVSNGNRRKTA